MKYVLVNADTREEREFDSMEAAEAYLANEKVKFAKREGIGMEHVNLSVSKDDPAKKLSREITDSPEFALGVQHALWASAHVLRKNGKTVADALIAKGMHKKAALLTDTRDVDFEFLHSLADGITAGEISAANLIEGLYKGGDAHHE